MDTLAKKIERTRHGLVRQGKTLVGRTTQAGRAFGSETGEATLVFARFVEREVRGWAGYAAARRTRAAKAAASVRAALRAGDLERRALLEARRALAELEGRIQRRLDRLHDAELPAPADEPAEANAPDSATTLARPARRRSRRPKILHQAG